MNKSREFLGSMKTSHMTAVSDTRAIPRRLISHLTGAQASNSELGVFSSVIQVGCDAGVHPQCALDGHLEQCC